MKLNLTNANYCATVVKVEHLIPLDNCDNLVGMPIFGYQCIVSKDVKVGDIGIVFTAEVELSDDYCKNNNLYRESELNTNKEAKGYIEKHRRVKAIKFRGNKSSALFMPLESLNYLGIRSDPKTKFELGDSFNEIDGNPICTKYIRIIRDPRNKQRGQTKKFERIDNKTFPEHIETDQYFRNIDKYKDNDIVTVTQKLHGTSGRFGYVKVRNPLKRYEKLLQKLGINISDVSYDYIAGSRKVIKDAKSTAQFEHYYKSDIWNEKLEEIKAVIPKDYILYGEIIGRIGESPIQKGYTYQIPKGMSMLYIYRIAIVNDDGISTDLSYKVMQEFCRNNGLLCVPLLRKGLHKDFRADARLDLKYYPNWYIQAVPLADESPCDEGVVVRKEGLTPYMSKCKSPIFYEFESSNLDKGEADIEQEESLLDNTTDDK